MRAAFEKNYAIRTTKRKVSYFYDPNIGSFYYGQGHPMKPQRMRMTHSLILSYGLYRQMDVYKPHNAKEIELSLFHDTTYLSFLGAGITDMANYAKKFNVSSIGATTDCPMFQGLYEFQRSCAGASIDAAMKLNHFETDIAINWSGGLHHAKRAEASGFCYINDIVLGIVELLKYHPRVMYIDIDIHHGDGVEEAFYNTPRVMTVSFHKYGDFFPGTGDIIDVGAAKGKYYVVNVPLDDGIDDIMFLNVFERVMSKCIDMYQPGAIVLQCGADSVAGDRLGTFNLSVAGHAACMEFIRSYNIPLMVLGGGGYTIRNVARTWLYETAVALNVQNTITDDIPINEFTGYYGPNNRLHVSVCNYQNRNQKKTLECLISQIHENLRHLEHVPGTEFAYIPPDFFEYSVDKVDKDEVEQNKVYDEGGGLAPGIVPSTDHDTTLMHKREPLELLPEYGPDDNKPKYAKFV